MKKAVAVVALFFLVNYLDAQKQSFTDSVAANYSLLNNMPFAELQLEDTSTHIFNTSSLAGKTIYVDFWFTTCPPCIKEIPFAKELEQYFAKDTNVVFLSICIDNIERKTAWKQMIKDRQMEGVQLFYARNRPQKINLLRLYKITFPTYLLVNKEMKVAGYNAPRPSEKGWVHWAIFKAAAGKTLAQAYHEALAHPQDYNTFRNGIFSNKTPF